jgi:hypothetical protein
MCSLVLSTFACQLDLGGPDPPGQPIPTSADIANELSRTWQTAINAAVTSGQIMVILDEVQLTTFLSKRLETSENPVLFEPMVYLRNNVVKIFGVYDRSPFRANILLAITPFIDQEGKVSFELTTVELGPIPVPALLKDTVSAILTESFTGTLGSLATGIRITSLAIAEGQVAIVGELR